jgi:hypothetical protein
MNSMLGNAWHRAARPLAAGKARGDTVPGRGVQPRDAANR